MSLVPAFQIGLWNAWIPMLVSLIPVFLIPAIARTREKGTNFTAAFDRKQKTTHVAIHVVYLVLIVYSIFLPLKLGTVWFYVGIPICAIGLAVYLSVFARFAAAPPDKPVTTGAHRVSRHPMYLSGFLIFAGIGTASASWVFLLLSVAYVTMVPVFVAAEERFCLQHYGDPYRDYLERTPRWIGRPGNKPVG